MVEPDTSVLSVDTRTRLRAAAFVLLAACVVTWYAVAPHLDKVSVWTAIAIIAAGVLPATLGLIYLALPLWSHHRIVAIGLAVSLIGAVVTWRADAHLASNFLKLAAYTFGGWAFLWVFEELSWVVLIALIGPTGLAGLMARSAGGGAR